MGEFLEYIRQQHFRGTAFAPKRRRMKPRSQGLTRDSISEITDLDKEGILNTSMHRLSKKERARLKRTTLEFKNLQKFDVPRHNCLETKKQVNRSASNKYLFACEFRTKGPQKFFADEENSAHQFSVRSQSIQVDNRVIKDIAMQTNLIEC